MPVTVQIDVPQRHGSDEAARLRRATAIAEIRHTYDGIRQRIIDQRDRSWREAMDSWAQRQTAAFEGVEIGPDGSLAGPARAVARARQVLDAEAARMPYVLGAIQLRAQQTWADAVRVRDARIYAYDFGLERGAA